MVTPRNQRYKRKVNSALDLAKMAADPKGFEYEQRTKSIIETKPGFGPFNDMINLSGVVRFGKENLDAQLADLLRWNKKSPGIIRSEDKYGQKVSFAGESLLPLNQLENILTGKGTKGDLLNAWLYTQRGGATAMKGLGLLAKGVTKPVGALTRKASVGNKYGRKMLEKVLSTLP
jgi:hypothetical protein